MNDRQHDRQHDRSLNPFDPGYFGSEELTSFGFSSVGHGVRVARNCTLIGLHNIRIGDNVRIDGPTTIAAARGECRIGSHVHIGAGCYLACGGGVSLKDFAGLSQGVCLYSVSDDYSGRSLTNPTIDPEYLNTKMAPILIGRHVIIGSGSIVLPGVEIGEGTAVGALTLVPDNLSSWGIYAGTPARLIRPRTKDLLAVEAKFLEAYRRQS